MSNYIENGLELGNKIFMTGVNACIKTWNWTTGGTKEDLANLMQIGATTVKMFGPFADNLNSGIACLIVSAPIEIYLTRFAMKKNKEQIALENKALENRVMDIKVERFYKPINKIVGLSLPAGSFLYHSYTLGNQEHMSKMKDLGWHYSDMVASSMRSVGCLAMCADNLPPRKNCLSRGYDKLSEMVKSYRPESLPIPAPAG